MADWHGTSYDRLSDPQFRWGLKVLDRLPLAGDETVLDAGCGSGRLTERLLARLPRGRVIAVDKSASMLAAAAERLAGHADRVQLVAADLQTFVASAPVSAIFSTATFHWVPDHDRLFRNLFASLAPGGRLVAQCGGGPNIASVVAAAARLMALPEYAPRFAGWQPTWRFEAPEPTAARMRAAGFVDVATSLEHEPTPFADAATFREFLATIVLRDHLAPLPEPLRSRFLDAIVDGAAAAEPPFVLDYWRLNIAGRRG